MACIHSSETLQDTMDLDTVSQKDESCSTCAHGQVNYQSTCGYGSNLLQRGILLPATAHVA